jgi:hypothetical protein
MSRPDITATNCGYLARFYVEVDTPTHLPQNLGDGAGRGNEGRRIQPLSFSGTQSFRRSYTLEIKFLPQRTVYETIFRGSSL